MQIHIKELALEAPLGVYAEEKNTPRPIVVNATLTMHGSVFDAAAQSDALADTLDYVAVENAIEQIASAKHYDLIEHLAYEIAVAVFALHPRIEQLSLEIEKPGALRKARTVAIQIDLMREDV